jgi:glucokinase
MPQYALGVDLGGTNLKVALVERERGVIRQAEHPTEAALGPDHVIARIAEAARAISGSEEVVGLGVGSPGVISLDRRSVSKPPNLPGWDVVNLAGALESALGLPVIVENDANVAGLGSAYYGAGQAFSSFIMVTLGTGVGGAILHEGKLFRGATGGAGEIGHLSIDYEGPYARSGVAGAVEAYLGQQFLTHHARYHLLTRESVLHERTDTDLRGLTPLLLYEAAKEGDEAAIEMLAWAGHKLGCALGSVVNFLDIRKVVVGGGVSAAGDFLLAPARAALRRFVMPAMADGVELVRETLGNEVALLGAARLAFERVED